MQTAFYRAIENVSSYTSGSRASGKWVKIYGSVGRSPHWGPGAKTMVRSSEGPSPPEAGDISVYSTYFLYNFPFLDAIICAIVYTVPAATMSAVTLSLF